MARLQGGTRIYGNATVDSTLTVGGIVLSSGGTITGGGGLIQSALVSPSGVATAAFTGLPSWVKRITIQFSALTSATASATMVVQLGTGATPTYATTGYTGTIGVTFNATASGAAAFSSGFTINTGFAANSPIYGTVTLTNFTGNNWLATINLGRTGTLMSGSGGGTVALGATLTAVQILSSANFNGGSVNILYE